MQRSTPSKRPASFTAATLVIAAGFGPSLPGCGTDRPPPTAVDSASSSGPGTPAAVPPPPGTARRIGGDVDARIVRSGENYSFDRCAITTPLPVGYPDPTPPGAIDLKSYPVVRRAEVTGSMNPDLGMNIAFFPLFRHISSRDISMTSPVEMDYQGISSGDAAPDSWTMSFLYRSPDLGPTGEDGRVSVKDQPPMTVVSLGGAGGYSVSNVEKGLETLESWLAANPEWAKAGQPRSLYYNGPEKRNKDKWYEVQIPVAPAGAETVTTHQK